MNIRKFRAYPLLVSVVGVGLIGALTGFDKAPVAAPTAPMAATRLTPLQEVAKKVMPLENFAGALLIGKNGELIPLDARGLVSPSCALPVASDAPTTASKAMLPNECAKTRDTTLLEINPVSVVRHTGSTCITVSYVSGGKNWYVQIPKGCTP